MSRLDDQLKELAASGKLADQLKMLGLLKRREAILNRRKKDASRIRKQFELAVFENMEGEGWRAGESGFTLGSLRFRPRRTRYARIVDRKALTEYLREHDPGVIESEKLREAELNRIVNERTDNGQELPPGLDWYDDVGISTVGITKQTQEDDDAEG